MNVNLKQMIKVAILKIVFSLYHVKLNINNIVHVHNIKCIYYTLM